MSFASQVRAFGQKTGIKTDMVVRKVVLDLGKEVVMRTPVGNPDLWEYMKAPPGYTGGTARSNWFFGYDRIKDTQEAHDKSGSASTKRLIEFGTKVKSGTVCYFTNNLPYIMRLEYGYSEKQAPFGMARITVARFQEVLDSAVRGL